MQYADAARDWGVKVPRIEAELANTALGAKGNFAVRGELSFRLKERTMTMAPFETVMTFDGSNVQLEQARLASSEIDAFLAGTIDRVLDSPALALTLKGGVNLDNAMRWVPPPPVPVTGMATIEGTISGPARDFATDLQVTSNTLNVGRERALDLAGPIKVTFDAFTGHDLAITPESGGTIRASFEVPWGGEGDVSSARASWSGLGFTGRAAARQRRSAADRRRPSPAPARLRSASRAASPSPTDPTGRAGRGLVPMTGTIAATIVGDNYSYDHDHAFPGFTFEGRMEGRINRGTALLTTMSGPAHARLSDVGEAVGSIETLGMPVAAIMHDVHGPLDAPMTLGGSYRYPEITTTVTSDALVVPLLGEVRASAGVVADTKSAAIAKIDIRKGTAAITGDVDGRHHAAAVERRASRRSAERRRAAGRRAGGLARVRPDQRRRDPRRHL